MSSHGQIMNTTRATVKQYSIDSPKRHSPHPIDADVVLQQAECVLLELVLVSTN